MRLAARLCGELGPWRRAARGTALRETRNFAYEISSIPTLHHARCRTRRAWHGSRTRPLGRGAVRWKQTQRHECGATENIGFTFSSILVAKRFDGLITKVINIPAKGVDVVIGLHCYYAMPPHLEFHLDTIANRAERTRAMAGYRSLGAAVALTTPRAGLLPAARKAEAALTSMKSARSSAKQGTEKAQGFVKDAGMKTAQAARKALKPPHGQKPNG